MSYEYHESHKHKLAKELLGGWLAEIDKHNDGCGKGNADQFPQLPFYWRSNYGVFLELPFHETDDQYYFECSDWARQQMDKDGLGLKTLVEPLQEVNRGKILFVPDITIFHKGCPKIFIEVIHKSPVSQKKVDRIINFMSAGFEIWTINADNILNQTNKYCNLKFTLLHEG